MSDTEEFELETGKLWYEPSNPTVADWVALATLNENLLDKEHNLTNHRMAWMMTTQAFLFGAFCIILINNPKDNATSPLLLNLIPMFGLVVSAAAFTGIIAAQSVIEVIERERSVYRKVLSNIFHYHKMPDIGFEREKQLSWTRCGGIWPPRILSGAIALLWFAVLLNRFGLSIVDRGL